MTIGKAIEGNRQLTVEELQTRCLYAIGRVQALERAIQNGFFGQYRIDSKLQASLLDMLKFVKDSLEGKETPH